MIYLDNAATTHKKPISLYPAIFWNTVKNSSNPGRGGHFFSMRASRGIYETAEALARLFNISDPERIAFTPNATYALNFAISGLLKKGDHALCAQTNHNSVLRPLAAACDFSYIPSGKDGKPDINSIPSMIRPETKMIIISHASNVLGTVTQTGEIGRIAKERGIVFLLDAAQTAGSYPIDAKTTGTDIIVFSGHKGLMTPMGVGGIYVKEDLPFRPVITGGTGSNSQSLSQPETMPDIFQSGTLDAPAIISAKRSIDFIIRKTPLAIAEKERETAKIFIEAIKNMKNVSYYGTDDDERNGTVAFNIKGEDSVSMAERLDKEYGIALRGGWHCAYPTHLLIGTEKTGALRASFGFFNSRRDAKKLIDAVYKLSKG